MSQKRCQSRPPDRNEPSGKSEMPHGTADDDCAGDWEEETASEAMMRQMLVQDIDEGLRRQDDERGAVSVRDATRDAADAEHSQSSQVCAHSRSARPTARPLSVPRCVRVRAIETSYLPVTRSSADTR